MANSFQVILSSHSGNLERLGSAKEKPLGGLTALHLAALSGQCGCVRVLVEAQANPNVVTESGQTPLLLCIKKWHLKKPPELARKMDFDGTFNALLSAGAHDLPDGETSLHAIALHWSSVCPRQTREIALCLLNEAQSQLHARGPKGGTPLHFAVNGRNWAVCSLDPVSIYVWPLYDRPFTLHLGCFLVI